MIKQKNEKISKMEDEYEDKLKDLRQQYQHELDRKKELDKELGAVKQELEDIE